MPFSRSYRVVFVDLDGTLLQSAAGTNPLLHGTGISETTAAVLRDLESRGVPVVVSTGRSLVSTRRVLGAGWPCSAPVATLNGALVVDRLHGTHLIELHFEHSLLCEIDDFCRTEPSVRNLVFDSTDTFFAWDRAANTEDIVRDYGHEGHSFAHASELDAPVFAVLLYVPQGRDAVFERLRERFAGRTTLTVYEGWPWIEIGHPRAGKGKALVEICRHLGVTPEEAVAFGDGSNDVCMFAAAGFAVAMGNAAECIRQRAHHVTLTNNEDGVAQILGKLSFKV